MSILHGACYTSILSDQNTEVLFVALDQYFAHQHVLFIHGQIFFILLLKQQLMYYHHPHSTQWPRVSKTLSSMRPVQIVSRAYRISTSLLCTVETRLFANFGPGLTAEKPEPLDN